MNYLCYSCYSIAFETLIDRWSKVNAQNMAIKGKDSFARKNMQEIESFLLLQVLILKYMFLSESNTIALNTLILQSSIAVLWP